MLLQRILISAIALFPFISSHVCNAAENFDAQKAILACVLLMEQKHTTKQQLDDELSRQWLEGFISRLDPNRTYFLDSDWQEFQRYEDRLDDLAKKGDFEFPELVRERYVERTQQAATYAEEFLNAKHDYSVDETYCTDFKTFAANQEQLRERWRLRIKAELMIEELHGRQTAEVQTQLSGRYQRIARQACEMTNERLCELYLNSLAEIYDPHTFYLCPTLLSTFEINVRLKSYQLGLVFRRQGSHHYLITSAHPSLQNANKLLGWSLMAIRRPNGETFDIVEMYPEDFFAAIRQYRDGPLGSDTHIDLELINPVTYKRATVRWHRFLDSDFLF